MTVLIAPRNFTLSIIFSLSILFFTMTFLLYWNEIAILLEEIGIDATLTGRTGIWEKTLNLLKQPNLLGFGYPSFDHAVFDVEWNYYRPAHPHNSFLQVYFELGLIGGTLLALLLYFHLKQIFIKFKGQRKVLNYLFYLMVLGSLVGSNYFGKPTILFVIFYVYLSFRLELNDTIS